MFVDSSADYIRYSIVGCRSYGRLLIFVFIIQAYVTGFIVINLEIDL